jgi:hypothetical protein
MSRVFVHCVMVLASAWACEWVWARPGNEWAPWSDWSFQTWWLFALTVVTAEAYRRECEAAEGTEGDEP